MEAPSLSPAHLPTVASAGVGAEHHLKDGVAGGHGELVRIVTEFRAGFLEGASPEGMCFVICWPLEGYLCALGFDCVMVRGSVRGEGNHCWIKFSDKKIIDPTASQFTKPSGKKMPEVFYGRKPAWYSEKEICS